MSVITTTVVSEDIRVHFEKMMLQHAIQATPKMQFVKRSSVPVGVGMKDISWFKRSVADATNVQTQTEGVAINTFSNFTLTKIDGVLVEYGIASRISDVRSWSELFNTMQLSVAAIGEEIALKIDELVRDVANAQTTGLGIQRANGAADWTTLNSNTAATAAISYSEIVRMQTILAAARAPKFGSEYVALMPPQVTRSLLTDTDIVNIFSRDDASRLYRGEVGKISAVRVVEDTNTFVAASSASAPDEFTFSTAAGDGLGTTSNVYTTLFLGQEAIGTADVNPANPTNVKFMSVLDADHSNPLAQYKTVGAKFYFDETILDTTFGIAYKSKAES